MPVKFSFHWMAEELRKSENDGAPPESPQAKNSAQEPDVSHTFTETTRTESRSGKSVDWPTR